MSVEVHHWLIKGPSAITEGSRCGLDKAHQKHLLGNPPCATWHNKYPDILQLLMEQPLLSATSSLLSAGLRPVTEFLSCTLTKR